MASTRSNLTVLFLSLGVVFVLTPNVREFLAAQVGSSIAETVALGDVVVDDKRGVGLSGLGWVRTPQEGGYDGTYRLHRASKVQGQGTQTSKAQEQKTSARWKVPYLREGEYDLYFTWPVLDDLSGDLKVTIRNYSWMSIFARYGGELAGEQLSQKEPPRGPEWDGVKWQKITTLKSGKNNKLLVELSGLSSVSYVADAIRFVRAGGGPICGNGILEPGEQCGDGDQVCEGGERCENCKCIPPSRCGDGVLDEGEECEEDSDCEVEEQCTKDCICKEPQECVPEGGSVAVIPGSPSCCEGLVRISPARITSNGQCNMLVGSALCSDCGNGTCEEWENKCNCEKDCGVGTQQCVQAGGKVAVHPDAPSCCEGLDRISITRMWGSMCQAIEGSELCSACGDGTCDEWEDKCNCEKDCGELPECGDGICEEEEDAWCPPCVNADPPCMAPCRASSCPQDCEKCAENGETVYYKPDFGPTRCCSKNAGIEPSAFAEGEMCIAPNDGSRGTCVDNWWRTCGDGECSEGEDFCNCPRDCKRPWECVKEGRSVPAIPGAPECCEGLEKISRATLVYNQCRFALGAFVCSACGNDVCEQWENECNCEDDCKEGPRCGDGVCEEGEKGTCPPCIFDDPPCATFAPCDRGCPKDCREKPVCGDGVCEDVEEITCPPCLEGAPCGPCYFCPRDCEEESECGDGKCSEGEGIICPPCVFEIEGCDQSCKLGSCPRDCVRYR